jgi:hypothetical protein
MESAPLLQFLSRPQRARRAGEWTPEKAVTFIVTLVATGRVTLAARNAGMSRKSAYALKSRDPAFASAWTAAIKAGATKRARTAPSLSKGDKVDEVDAGGVPAPQGDKTARDSRWSNDAPRRQATAEQRDLFFARLASFSRPPACG